MESVRPLLDAEPGVRSWAADVSTPDKVPTVEGDGVSAARVGELLGRKGYQVVGEVPQEVPETAPAGPAEPETSYYPLLLIPLYIAGVTALVEASAGSFHRMRAMNHFMAGFFLVFSFFKRMNLRAFADAYAGYDVVAARWRPYGFVAGSSNSGRPT